ncbi:acetyl-CoA acetyltransferase [Allopusillimonas ginsengisoli]|uniref:acetyl-CoA acetyltransferase n=1 Tax=Allopusillimonas ginsengisoli TaxID=453575 RepID=UPI001022465F|nr:acetyl-CoA acetyltransferase [Allopusillimonas ginsengisoli]TEA79986.1 thiolase [Allopusillimonas ginsengisoli]
MKLNDISASVAVTGIGTAGLGEASGFTELEILAHAAQAAVADAGLGMKDIDGLMTASFSRFLPSLSVAEYLNVQPAWMDSSNVGGASYVNYLLTAALALNAGLCNAVLVVYGSTARTQRDFREHIRARGQLEPQPYEAPYKPFNPATSYALAAARHMHEFGTTREQLAQVAVSARKWAQLNPDAFMREALSVQDVLASRMISDPLTVRDCCLLTDGAGAFVMTRADRAGHASAKPVYLLGAGASQTHRQISGMPDLTTTAAVESGRKAYAMAGLQPSDIDVLQLYDAFTINVILFLEDLGFCRKGEGGAFVQSGAIEPGGGLPVNTNGGGLSCVHPGMYGVFTVIEAVRQLRGDAGDRQVPQVETVLCHGNGGVLASQVTAILGSAATR